MQLVSLSVFFVLTGTAYNMTQILYFSETEGRGATLRLASGEPCLISIAQSGVLVKKSRFGFFGTILYNETNPIKAVTTAEALEFLFPDKIIPDVFTDRVLISFVNAIWRCSTTSEVKVTLNEAIQNAAIHDKDRKWRW